MLSSPVRVYHDPLAKIFRKRLTCKRFLVSNRRPQNHKNKNVEKLLVPQANASPKI